ncbi:hypothetical protein GE061_019309 [Apolygus lucorum]|uniref:Uncharacterized protein n=1 Tax=Apolygus lucorum TaxID=248454 RepID=A0A6A4JFP0_APOLU|nr:hypothetical protein GE061_019309 [Apolygus lucorum]
MIAFCLLVVATAGSLAEGGAIGNTLQKMNGSMQTGVSGVKNTINQILDLGNTTINSGADLVSSASGQLSNVAIDGLDATANIADQGLTMQQDTINSILNIANGLPVVSKVNGVVSGLVNGSIGLAKDNVNFWVGGGQAGVGMGNAAVSIATGTAASAASAATEKLKEIFGKGSSMVSNGISSGIAGTSGAIQKIGGLFSWAGGKIESSATLPSSTSSSTTSS